MRAIKFRAWDGRKMVIGHNLMLDTFDGRAYWQFGYQAPEPMESTTVLMQFTGLHDKNGREIYEGDIVRAWSEGDCRVLEVRWRQEGAPPCYILYPAWHDGKFWNLYGSYVGNEGKCVDPCEVIGNIHENPELLK